MPGRSLVCQNRPLALRWGERAQLNAARLNASPPRTRSRRRPGICCLCPQSVCVVGSRDCLLCLAGQQRLNLFGREEEAMAGLAEHPKIAPRIIVEYDREINFALVILLD